MTEGKIPAKAPEVRGISAQEFAAWRHHPVTKVFRLYLEDKRAFFERTALNQWVNGDLTLYGDEGRTIRGQIIELIELADLPFEALVAFYQETADAA